MKSIAARFNSTVSTSAKLFGTITCVILLTQCSSLSPNTSQEVVTNQKPKNQILIRPGASYETTDWLPSARLLNITFAEDVTGNLASARDSKLIGWDFDRDGRLDIIDVYSKTTDTLSFYVVRNEDTWKKVEPKSP